MSRVVASERLRTVDAWVTDEGNGQGRSALAAVRALAAGGYRAGVAASGRWSLARASRFAVATVTVRPPDSEGYSEAIAALRDGGSPSIVFPSSDAALLALGAPVGHLVDKSRLVAVAEAAGLPTPPTRWFNSADELLASHPSYPVVVKQPISRVPPRKVSNAAELAEAALTPGPYLVQPFIDAPLWAVGGVAWNGRMIAAVHQRYRRTWPPDCGTASSALTVEPEEAIEDRLLRLLAGYDGIFQAQFAGDFLIDLNLRVYGSLPLGLAAGVNLPAIVCDLVRGVEVRPQRARPGVAYRWLEGDLRAVLRLVRSGRLGAARELLPRPGIAHSVASIRDPRPILTRIGYAAWGRR